MSDFSTSPLMRYCSVSECSGEEYYHNFLNAAFKKALDAHDTLIVNMDGVDGYSPSFIDEVFGNLVYDFSLKVVQKNLKIISDEEPEWDQFIKEETFPQWEERRKKKMVPKITQRHDAWWRLDETDQMKLMIWGEPQNV